MVGTSPLSGSNLRRHACARSRCPPLWATCRWLRLSTFAFESLAEAALWAGLPRFRACLCGCLCLFIATTMNLCCWLLCKGRIECLELKGVGSKSCEPWVIVPALRLKHPQRESRHISGIVARATVKLFGWLVVCGGRPIGPLNMFHLLMHTFAWPALRVVGPSNARGGAFQCTWRGPWRFQGGVGALDDFGSGAQGAQEGSGS